MARKLNAESRVTVGMTKRQRYQQIARRASQTATPPPPPPPSSAPKTKTVTPRRPPAKATKSTKKETRASSSAPPPPTPPALPRFQLKLLNPCGRHTTDVALPCRPQAALLAPFYQHHWHIGLEHHVFTPDIVAEHAAWRQKHNKSGRRGRQRGPVSTQLKWSTQNVVWPAERWIGEVPHLVLGRHPALPRTCQLRHPCVGRVHARLVCIHTPAMHRFFSECFPRVRVAREVAPVRVTVVEGTERNARRGRHEAASVARRRRASPPRLRHRADEPDKKAAQIHQVEDDDEEVGEVVEESRASHGKSVSNRVHSLSEPDSDSEEDDTEPPAPFDAPYFCLVNYHDNLVYVNRTAVRCGRSVHLQEGDIISLLECAFGGDGGVLDPIRVPAADSEAVGAAESSSSPSWSVADAATLAATQELPGLEAWVALALDRDAASAAQGVTHRSLCLEEEEEEDAENEEGEEGPLLSTSSAMVVADYVAAARRPLDVPLALSHLVSLWQHLTSQLRGDGVEVRTHVAEEEEEDDNDDDKRRGDSTRTLRMEGLSPHSPPPLVPLTRPTRSRSPTASTVPLNDAASASRAAHSLRASLLREASASSPAHRAPSMLAVVHNQLAVDSSSRAGHKRRRTADAEEEEEEKGHAKGHRRGALFAHLPPSRDDWTSAVRQRVLEDVAVALDALDGRVVEAVTAVQSPLAPALVVEAAHARRAFAQLTRTLVAEATAAAAAAAAQSGASRQLFSGAGGGQLVKREPYHEDDTNDNNNSNEEEDAMNVMARWGVKTEKVEDAAAEYGHTAIDGVSPLRQLVQQLRLGQDTDVSTGVADPAHAAHLGASPGRLVWEASSADERADTAEAWSGDGLATDKDPQTKGGVHRRGSLSPLPMPGHFKELATEDDGLFPHLHRAPEEAGEEEDDLAPMAVAHPSVPFLQLMPATLPVYVFTRRAASPERCLRETSSWRQRYHDGAAAQAWAGEGHGAVYYYYEEEDEAPALDGEAEAVGELNAMAGRRGAVSGADSDARVGTSGQAEGLSDEGPLSSTPEEPVWIDETGPMKKKGSGRKNKPKRRRCD